jgi:hypothetical protein
MFERAELERAFAAYLQASQRAAASGDWTDWADHFTEDVTYVEHHFGTFCGRETVRDWIVATMTAYPGKKITSFPVPWYVIDEQRGWVVCMLGNQMSDPGDGSVHRADNITILHYAGDGLWSYEEDVYNPAHFANMATGWSAAATISRSSG